MSTMNRFFLGTAMLGLAALAGCPLPPPADNDNALVNDNSAVNENTGANDNAGGNDNAGANDNTAANDNVGTNDNTGSNANENANDNVDNDNIANENDNVGGATERDFVEFIYELFDATADNTEPTAIDNITFTFDEDPAAFDGLIDNVS